MKSNNRHSLFLMDCWNAAFYQQLVKPEPTLDDKEAPNDELKVSKIGHFAWENGRDFSMISTTAEIESDLGDSEKRERRSRANGGIVKSLFKDILSSSDPHLLIPPFKFGEPGLIETEKQPFRVFVHPQVPLTCDVHAHLSDAEVIGFLAGRWDALSRILYIQAAIPCSSTTRDEDDGAIDVELDPEAEFLAREIITSLNLQVVGWYHSHPKFRADPSLIDCQNQQQYQNFMKDEISGLEPFVGLIISTYDKQLTDGKSFHRWFAVREYSDEKNITVSMPIEIDVEILQYTINEEEFRKDEGTVIREGNIMQLRCSNEELTEPNTTFLDQANTVKIEKIEGSEIQEQKSEEERTKTNQIEEVMTEKSVNVVEEDPEGNNEEQESLPLPLSFTNLPNPLDQRYFFEDGTNPFSPVASEGSSNKITSAVETSFEVVEDSTKATDIGETPEASNLVKDGSFIEPDITATSVDQKEELPFEDASGVRRSRRQPKPNGFYKEREETEFREKLKTPKVKVKTPQPEKKGGRKRKLENDDSCEQVKEETEPDPKLKKKAKTVSLSLALPSASSSAIPTRKGKRKSSLPHPTRTILDSFVLTVQDPKLLSSALARKIVISTPVYLRFVAISLLSVGFHFSRFYRRTELLQSWKSQIKLDKLAISANRWAEYFLVERLDETQGKQINPQIVELLKNLFVFLKSCWEEYSAKSGKVKLIR
eukprot:gene791-843_t